MPSEQARLYHQVLTGYVEAGVAPHYVEVAKTLGWTTDHARTVLHEVVGTGLPVWLHPGTDLIASFAPFSSVPTLYRISIDATPHGYAQCGLEALAVSWLFPGREVRIDSLAPTAASRSTSPCAAASWSPSRPTAWSPTSTRPFRNGAASTRWLETR